MPPFKRLFVGLILLGAFIGWLSLLHAQESSASADLATAAPVAVAPLALMPADVATFSSLSEAQLAALVSELAAAPTLTMQALPGQGVAGTFWSLQNPDSAPLPFDSSGSAVWPLGDGSFLLNDLNFSDRAAPKPALPARPSLAMSQAPGDLGDGSGTNRAEPAAFTPTDYGTNLLLIIQPVANQVADLILSNTQPGVLYEIQSFTNLASTNWISAGGVYGSAATNWTPISVLATNDPALFFQVRSWADDGSGLPLWWQKQYFDTTEVDPYGDPMGDGWNNLQKFQNGWDPTVFYTPPAPQGLAVNYNANNGTAKISWLPSPGPVTGYTIRDSEGNTTSFPATATLFLADVSAAQPDPLSFGTITTTYTVQAHYAGGSSAVSAAVPLELASFAGSIVSGLQGATVLTVQAMPANTTGIRLTEINEYALDSEAGTIFVTNFTVPISSFTNGSAVLANVQAPDDDEYFWVGQAVGADGSLSATTGLASDYNNHSSNAHGNSMTVPFYDGRVQLKQNLIFKLRAAGTDQPFKFYYFDPVAYADYLYEFYDPPTNHVESSLLHVTDVLTDPEYANLYDYYHWHETLIDPVYPFTVNALFENFVFNLANITSYSGGLKTGVSFHDYSPSGDVDLGLDTQPSWSFLPPTTGWTTVTALLATNDTRWICSIPVDPDTGSISARFFENGVTAAGGTYGLTANTKNVFGLPFLSEKLVDASETGLIFQTISAGNDYPLPANANENSMLYAETAQPEFQTVEYDFWDSAPHWNGALSRSLESWLPGSHYFSPTNQSQLLITAVNSQIQVAGYAKLAVLNGYSGVYGYLGQYFEGAYQITNGVVTTNATGILSSYGNFYATEPGPAALVTMPDLDTGERGTCTVYCVSLAVDKNHDGIMDTSFNGADGTSPANPMVCWVNNGYIKPGSNGGLDQDLPLPLNDPASANSAQGKITCPRDLENFFRLWACGLPAALSNQNYYVTLTCTAISGTPAINLYYAETNGGIGYLTDTNVAGDLAGQSKFATISPTSSDVLPFWVYDGSNLHFLFEGAGIGEGQFTLTIYQGTTAIAQTSAYIDLRDVKDFFEHPRATDVSLNDPPTTNSGAFHIDSYATANGAVEDQQIIIYVHGLNNKQFDYESSSETIFKRLYWQGYNGRYAAFRWPSPTWSVWPSTTNEISYFNYNKGEYISWQSGAALKNYIDDLHIRFPGYNLNIITISEGGFPANAAIRLGAQVDNLVLSKVTAPAEAFDGNNSSLIYNYLAASANNTPDADILGGYNNCFTNQCRRVNFYNDDDFACYTGAGDLVSWEQVQLFLRPDYTAVSPGWFYSFDGTNCFKDFTDIFGDVTSARTLTDDFEKKSYVARSRTKALGAAGLAHAPQALTGGVISTNISLQDISLGFVGGASFNNTRSDHGGEFNKAIQNTTPFYFQLMKIGFQLQPKISP